MRSVFVALGLACVVLAAPARAAEPSAAEKAAVFKAAGFKAKGGQYVRCEDDVTASFSPGRIEWQDLNGDGVNEAFVLEGSLFCYGNTAEAVVIVAKNAKGEWGIVLDQVGVAVPLETKTKGWLDIEVGGPGMGPFPRYKYDGKTYVAKKK
ncbi:MAG: hypothetical protein ACKVRO_03970 [Micropepsaceae bacterium]